MKKISKILVSIMLLALIIASVIWYLFVYDRSFTRDTLLSQARFQDMHGNSRISSWFYDAAYVFSDHDQDVAIELANQYKSDGNYTKAEYTLTYAINTGATAELYAALCQTYVQQDKLLDAVNMLDNINDPAIKEEMDAMRPSAPSADYAPGYFSQYMDIHLSSTSKTIYYTLDGNYPSVNGSRYEGSISLPAGETTVYAIAVDEKGLVSPVTVLSYTIAGVIEEVTFTDAAMEASLRTLIGADPDDTVFTNELWNIKEFTTPEGVKDYSDLRLLPYLEKLTISDTSLNTLGALSTLDNLKTLDLSGSRFSPSELAVLATLPSLTSLTMAECGLSTIADLADAQYLTHLDLSSNTIRNLDVLTPMTTLQTINLDHNAVTDLSALSSLINLETLTVSYNSLKSLEPVSGCVKLRHLEADHNQIGSLRGVDVLPLLSHLSVDYNQLTNINRLESCTELVNLSFASNEIVDLSPIKKLTKIEVLDFSSNKVEILPDWVEGCALITIDGSYNQLAKIDGLAIMEHLTHIYMDYNLIENVDALENCFCLVQVNVYGNPIPDVEKLRDHDIIVNYDPTAAEDKE